MAVLGAVAQVVLTARSWADVDLAGRVCTVWLSLYVSATAASMLIWPAFYVRNHRWLMPLGRAIVHSAPSWRRTRVGAAMMLEQPARPGWLGAATDAVRVVAGEKCLHSVPCAACSASLAAAAPPPNPATIAWPLPRPRPPAPGTRTLTLIVGGLAIPQEPSLTAATQALLLASIRSSGPHGYCDGTTLLTDVASRRRAVLVGEALDWVSLPVAFLVPAVGTTTRPTSQLHGERCMRACWRRHRVQSGLQLPAPATLCACLVKVCRRHASDLPSAPCVPLHILMQAGAAFTRDVCDAELLFVQLLLGVLLPIVISTVSWRAPQQQPEEPRAGGPPAAAAGDTPPASAPCLAARVRRLPAIADAVLVRCNAMLARLVVPSTLLGGVGIVHAWWLAVLAWWVCKAFAGLPS